VAKMQTYCLPEIRSAREGMLFGPQMGSMRRIRRPNEHTQPPEPRRDACRCTLGRGALLLRALCAPRRFVQACLQSGLNPKTLNAANSNQRFVKQVLASVRYSYRTV
jgi:hypothetical protein